MAQITSREELEEWLKDKPIDWAQVIAARAALRALPFAFDSQIADSWVESSALFMIRALFISWAARNSPGHGMTLAAAAAADSMSQQHSLATAPFNTAVVPNYRLSNYDLTAAVGARSLTSSINQALAHSVHKDAAPYNAAAAAVRANANFAVEKSIAGFAVRAVAEATSGYPALWQHVHADCDWLSTRRGMSGILSYWLASEKLWLVPLREPEECRKARIFAFSRLTALHKGYVVWIDWYNLRIEGHDAAFYIPGDTDRKEDKAILARLADATDEDFWGKGATYVNTTLQSWIDEARERVRPDETLDEPPPPTPDAIRAVAAQIASPTVTLTNNQLDVITNAAFDGQTDTANLDEAIAILRAVVAALLGGLPGNAPRSFAANLTIYDAELAKRDAKPFLGVLVRMEKSVSAGFHADPEMFDASVTTNFESYFEAHLAFMTHYRRNEEREAKIAQFKIDDAVASGIALTGPVDEVAKEVAALAEQGLVTEGYAQAVKEQQEINTQIALYSSSLPTPSGEPTAKERHILQTVGFYERSLAVATNIVSVSTQFAAFIIVLREAIEALLKFFV